MLKISSSYFRLIFLVDISDSYFTLIFQAHILISYFRLIFQTDISGSYCNDQSSVVFRLTVFMRTFSMTQKEEYLDIRKAQSQSVLNKKHKNSTKNIHTTTAPLQYPRKVTFHPKTYSAHFPCIILASSILEKCSAEMEGERAGWMKPRGIAAESPMHNNEATNRLLHFNTQQLEALERGDEGKGKYCKWRFCVDSHSVLVILKLLYQSKSKNVLIMLSPSHLRSTYEPVWLILQSVPNLFNHVLHV